MAGAEGACYSSTRHLQWYELIARALSEVRDSSVNYRPVTHFGRACGFSRLTLLNRVCVSFGGAQGSF